MEILSTFSLLQPSLRNNLSVEIFHAGSQLVPKMEFYMQIDKIYWTIFCYVTMWILGAQHEVLQVTWKGHYIVIFSAVWIQWDKNETHMDCRRKSFLPVPFTDISTGHTNYWAHVFPKMSRRVSCQQLRTQPTPWTATECWRYVPMHFSFQALVTDPWSNF